MPNMRDHPISQHLVNLGCADAETLCVRCRDAHLSEAIAAGVPWHLTGANTDRDD